ncbi:MAG: hypothetical protein ABIE74_02250 [Pseudomonadota bacterium]
MRLKNFEHAIGATLAGELAMRSAIGEGKIEIVVDGYAGHGFGFGATNGMKLRMKGYVNDAVGEAMSGDASIVVVPPQKSVDGKVRHLVGNAAAYGATGGNLFVAGKAGQRFGVRNSGAILVCEGVGKYAFEYMTGGTGVVLGRCGRCLGSGMTGGELYIYDSNDDAPTYLHPDVCSKAIKLTEERGRMLRKILEEYFKETKSPLAGQILKNWTEEIARFVYICQ